MIIFIFKYSHKNDVIVLMSFIPFLIGIRRDAVIDKIGWFFIS